MFEHRALDRLVWVQGQRGVVQMALRGLHVDAGQRHDHRLQLDARALPGHRGFGDDQRQRALGIRQRRGVMAEQRLDQDGHAPPAHQRGRRGALFGTQRIDAQHDALQAADMAAPQQMKCQRAEQQPLTRRELPMQQALGALGQRFGQRMPRHAVDHRGQQAGHQAHLDVFRLHDGGARGVRVEHRQPAVQRLDAAQADQRSGGGGSSGELAIDIVRGHAAVVGKFEIAQRRSGVGVQRTKAAPVAQRAELLVGQAVDGAAQGFGAAAGHICRRVVLQHPCDFGPALRLDQALQAGIELAVRDQQQAGALLHGLALLRRVHALVAPAQEQAEQIVEHVHRC